MLRSTSSTSTTLFDTGKLNETSHDHIVDSFPIIMHPLFKSMKWKIVRLVEALMESQTTNIINTWHRHLVKETEEALESAQCGTFLQFACPHKINNKESFSHFSLKYVQFCTMLNLNPEHSFSSDFDSIFCTYQAGMTASDTVNTAIS
jgi:hypothetical protein